MLVDVNRLFRMSELILFSEKGRQHISIKLRSYLEASQNYAETGAKSRTHECMYVCEISLVLALYLYVCFD